MNKRGNTLYEKINSQNKIKMKTEINELNITENGLILYKCKK